MNGHGVTDPSLFKNILEMPAPHTLPRFLKVFAFPYTYTFPLYYSYISPLDPLSNFIIVVVEQVETNGESSARVPVVVAFIVFVPTVVYILSTVSPEV